MVELDELKSVLLLTYLQDAMLKKVAEITQIETYRSGDYIFREGDDAGYLYAVFEGLRIGSYVYEKNC